MKLIDQTVTDFTAQLASCSPAPGGGSVAALSGALGAALLQMVGELTLGSKKYDMHHEAVLELKDKAARLRQVFLELIDADTASFNTVSAAYQMPKDSEEAKQARSEAIQRGLKASTLTPLQMMEAAHESLMLVQHQLKGFNVNAASDLGVACLQLHGAAHGAWLNVLINLATIKDNSFKEVYYQKGKTILQRVDDLNAQIQASVAVHLR